MDETGDQAGVALIQLIIQAEHPRPGKYGTEEEKREKEREPMSP
jgi:hypothetical protein